MATKKKAAAAVAETPAGPVVKIRKTWSPKAREWNIFAADAANRQVGATHTAKVTEHAVKITERLEQEHGLTVTPEAEPGPNKVVSAEVWARTGGPNGRYGEAWRAGHITIGNPEGEV